MPHNLSKSAQVLKFFAQACPEDCTHLRLMKLTYMADLEARKLLGEPISGFVYIYYKHGPFDEKLYPSLGELERGALIDRQGYVVIDKGVEVTFEFTPAEQEILRYIAATYGTMPIEAFTRDVVYKTEPMLNATRDALVPMRPMNNIDKRMIGFDLGRVIAGETQIRAGHSTPAAVFFDELRGHISGAGDGGGQRIHA